MDTVLTPAQHFWFVEATSYLAICGGLALWGGFIWLGAITRRFERAYGKMTHWQFFLLAPAGLCAYLVLQAVASLRHQNMGAAEQWIGYSLLTWSAGLCLWGVLRLRKVLAELERET